MIDVCIGLFSGVAFGFVIQRVGATNPQKMVLAHLMTRGLTVAGGDRLRGLGAGTA